MVFQVNGTDITPYIANQGLKWSRNDIDGPNAGRALDGTMYRDRVAIKYRWDVTCKPLLQSEMNTILSLVQPEYINVTFTDPVTGTTKTVECYSNNIPAQYLIYKDGKEYWSGITFPLIER